MGITLNILEHELQRFGVVERHCIQNPSFDEARIYLGKESLQSVDMVYVCDDLRSLKAILKAGFFALYLSSEKAELHDALLDGQGYLCIFNCEGKLYIFNELLDIFSRYAKWENDLAGLCFKGAEIQSLLDISTPFLKNNVVILDAALKLLAYSKDVPCDDPITMELIEHGYHTEGNIRKFNLHKRFRSWVEEDGFVINDTFEICKYVTAVYSFKTGASFSLIMVMMCNMEELSPYLLDVFEKFAAHIEYYANKEYPVDKPAGNAIDAFLKDIFEGKQLDPESIKERSGIVGIPYEARFCIFYTEVDSDTIPFFRLLSDIARAVAPAKAVVVGNAIVVLCFNCLNERCVLHCESKDCLKGGRSCSSRLNALLSAYDITCGRSSKFNILTKAKTAYLQAKYAHSIQSEDAAKSVRPRDEWTNIKSFDLYYVDFLFSADCNEHQDLLLQTYAGSILDQIHEYDAMAKTDNYDFLREYLNCERRASITADSLHMHRNNVKYRIDRIEQQFGIDTDDPELRFDLMLAYRFRDYAIVQNA